MSRQSLNYGILFSNFQLIDFDFIMAEELLLFNLTYSMVQCLHT